jgi:hypothetical protein
VASKSARKRRKRRPPPPSQVASTDGSGAADESQPAAPPRALASTTSAARPRRRGEPEPPPEPPWGKFPLIELSVLIGIIMLILGFFVVGGPRGPILIASGLILGSIGGLELSLREHFTGYRSHTLLLAGVPALIVLGALFYAGPDSLPRIARAGIGLAVFGGAALLLTRAFQSRSGGRAFKLRPDRR